MEQTTIGKAIDAGEGQQPKGRRGYYDKAAKKIVATRWILAWIVHACVHEAREYPIAEIAANYIEYRGHVSAVPVHRDDKEAAEGRARSSAKKNAVDPGSVRMEHTDDESISEGTVHYDILFCVRLPGEDEPILIMVNVEVQNLSHVGYKIPARASYYGSRLFSEQAPNYADLHKVYSIWIVSDPTRENENTIVRFRTYGTTEKVSETGAFDVSEPQIDPDADWVETCIVNLGEPEQVANPEDPNLLWLLDTLFSKNLITNKKKNVLEKEFSIPMSKKLEKRLRTMETIRFAFEDKAEARGEARGKILGEARGKILGEARGRFNTLMELVRDGVLTMEAAAERMGMSVEDFAAFTPE